MAKTNLLVSLTDFRQATTKMVTKESQVVADVAPDIPDNETFPQIDSLVHKLDDIMKSINTICLKDYRNLMKYRKEIKRGNPISNFRNDDPISSTLISISTLTSGAYLETLANSIPGTLHDRYTSSLQNMASNSISGAQLSSSLPYQVSRFLPNRPRRALRTRTSTHRMRQMSNSSESGPDDESQFTNSYSTTPPFSSVQTTRISKNTRENVPVKTPSFPPQALLTSSAPSGPINPPKHDATNRCIETLIEFAGFTKDFRIWYMERLRRASSAVLRSLALQA